MRNVPRSRWCWLGGWTEHERSGPSIAGSPEIARCGTRSSHFERQGRDASLQGFAQRGSDSGVGDAHSFAASKKVVRTPGAALAQAAMWLESSTAGVVYERPEKSTWARKST